MWHTPRPLQRIRTAFSQFETCQCCPDHESSCLPAIALQTRLHSSSLLHGVLISASWRRLRQSGWLAGLQGDLKVGFFNKDAKDGETFLVLFFLLILDLFQIRTVPAKMIKCTDRVYRERVQWRETESIWACGRDDGISRPLSIFKYLTKVFCTRFRLPDLTGLMIVAEDMATAASTTSFCFSGVNPAHFLVHLWETDDMFW